MSRVNKETYNFNFFNQIQNLQPTQGTQKKTEIITPNSISKQTSTLENKSKSETSRRNIPNFIDDEGNIIRFSWMEDTLPLDDKEKRKNEDATAYVSAGDLEYVDLGNGIRRVHVKGSSIRYDDGVNHDQVMPNPRVEDVNLEGLHRMAEIVRSKLNK